MIDERERFARAFDVFEMPEPAFERMRSRRERRRRDQRLAAGILGLAIAILGAVVAFRTLSSNPNTGDTSPSPSRSQALTQRFSSPNYGFIVMLPPDWAVVPAELPWTWGGERRSDVIQAAGSDTPVSGYSFNINIASIEVPSTEQEDVFIESQHGEFADIKAGSCGAGRPTTSSIELFGVAGRKSTACDGDIFITIHMEPRVYVIWTSGGAVTTHVDLVERVLATIQFHPELAIAGPTEAEWRGIWPQSTRAGALEAQRRANEGNPDVAWQVDRNQMGTVAQRFVTQELGWKVRDTGVSYVPGDTEQAWEAEIVEWYFIRCAPGRTNPLYPDDDCAPTIDETHYVQIVVYAEQLIRRGREGIWSITGYDQVGPYVQTRPIPTPDAREQVERFLQARIEGQGAEVFLQSREIESFPLLYATTSGSAYVDATIIRVRGPEWPFARLEFEIRLVTQGGDVVVRQRLSVFREGVQEDGPIRIANQWMTTENGEVVDSPFG